MCNEQKMCKYTLQITTYILHIERYKVHITHKYHPVDTKYWEVKLHNRKYPLYKADVSPLSRKNKKQQHRKCPSTPEGIHLTVFIYQNGKQKTLVFKTFP